MLVKKQEMPISIDVDDTLVMYTDKVYEPGEDKVRFECPYNGEAMYLVPNKRHIDFLKTQKARGRYVRVHSAGGWAWAEAVVKTLGLEDHVDEVCTKDIMYVDDLPADQWMDRIYFK